MADLTIIMPAFNKEKYIAEALDSIFSQRTGYSYEIVVADDCSTDGTLDIVARYEKAHPGAIRVLRSDRNLKLFRNVVRVYADLRTPYFCVLDPDDYWTDPLKIQKSLDFLETHRDFTVYTANSLMRGPGQERPYVACPQALDSDFDDYLRGHAALGQTAGAVYRNVVFAEGLPPALRNLRPDQERTFRGDAFRNLVHLHEGRAHFEPACEAVYRLTDEGLWQGATELRRRLANVLLFLNMDEYFDCRHDGLLAMAECRYRAVLADLPSLLPDEPDMSAVRDRLSAVVELGRRLKAADADGRRMARSLSFRHRLYYLAYRWLSRKGKRQGWS